MEDAIREGGGASYARDGEPTTVARLVRNLIMGCEYLMSHITHFWQLAALDYVQGPNMAPFTPYFADGFYNPVLLSPTASGKRIVPTVGDIDGATSLTFPRAVPAPGAVNDAGAGYTSLDGIWDNVIVDYLSALRWRRETLAVAAKLAGRTPQVQSILAGGVTYRPTAADINAIKQVVGTDSGGVIQFLKKRQIPTAQILSYLYGDYGGATTGSAQRKYDNDGTNKYSGWGSGNRNFLSFGVFNEANSHGSLTNPDRLLKRGYIYGEDGSVTLSDVTGDSPTSSNIVEFIYGSHYRVDTNVDSGSGYFSAGIQPWSGYTDPEYDLDTPEVGGYNQGGYSWVKSPRILHGGTGSANAIACQVGPLSRMAVTAERGVGVGYSASANFTATAATLDIECQSYKLGEYKSNVMHLHPSLWPIIAANVGPIATLFGPPPGMAVSGSPIAGFLCGNSVMDRHRARAYEALKIAKRVVEWCDDLLNNYLSGNGTYTGASANYAAFTSTAMSGGPYYGRGMHEAPRGALSHWITITDGKIANYQCVVPTTWNCSPRHAAVSSGAAPAFSEFKRHGPVEQAIRGHSTVTNSQPTIAGTLSHGSNVPVEVLRIVHSFDPCIACAVH